MTDNERRGRTTSQAAVGGRSSPRSSRNSFLRKACLLVTAAATPIHPITRTVCNLQAICQGAVLCQPKAIGACWAIVVRVIFFGARDAALSSCVSESGFQEVKIEKHFIWQLSVIHPLSIMHLNNFVEPAANNCPRIPSKFQLVAVPLPSASCYEKTFTMAKTRLSANLE